MAGARMLLLVPPFAFGINGDGGFLVSAYNRHTEISICHGPGSEFYETLVVEFMLLILFENFPPINILPQFIDNFTLYLMEVRLRAMLTAR
jgi:hypothetical protein